VQRFIVSAGIYALSSGPRSFPTNQFFDMPTLFDTMLQVRMVTRVHQIDGYWLDIGRLPDLERANSDFHNLFN